jgi:hypothetical protein
MTASVPYAVVTKAHLDGIESIAIGDRDSRLAIHADLHPRQKVESIRKRI